MESINERIRLLMRILGHNNNSFAKALGVNPTVTFNIIGGRGNNPSFEFLEKLLFTFDNINPAWLLKGEGEMFMDKSKVAESVKNDLATNADQLIAIDLLKEQLKASNETNKDLLIILKNFSNSSGK